MKFRMTTLIAFGLLTLVAFSFIVGSANAQAATDGTISAQLDTSPYRPDPDCKDSTITGTLMDDEIYSPLDRNNIIEGRHGDDLLWGGFCNDYITGAHGVDEIRGFSGNDVLYGGPGFDYIDGGEGFDICHAEVGEQVVDCEVIHWSAPIVNK